MPVPPVISAATANYQFNSDFLAKTVADLSPDEWLQSPTAGATNVPQNHMSWIVGHCVWARKALLGRLGTEWSQPWLSLFARGVKLDDATTYPSSEILLANWREVSGILASALESVSPELLAQPSKQGPPSADGKLSGVVNFLAIHETYHLGQASYLRGWLGYKGLMG